MRLRYFLRTLSLLCHKSHRAEIWSQSWSWWWWFGCRWWCFDDKILQSPRLRKRCLFVCLFVCFVFFSMLHFWGMIDWVQDFLKESKDVTRIFILCFADVVLSWGNWLPQPARWLRILWFHSWLKNSPENHCTALHNWWTPSFRKDTCFPLFSRFPYRVVGDYHSRHFLEELYPRTMLSLLFA